MRRSASGRMNPGTEIQKPLRARKTMPQSSRKQMVHLSRRKAAEGAAGPAGPVEASGAQEEAGARLKPLPAKEPLAGLLVNSEISIYKDPQEMLQDLPNRRFLSASTLQDILSYCYEKGSGCPLSKPVEASLDSALAAQLPDRLPVASSTHRKADGAAETPGCQTLPALQEEERRFGVPETDRVVPAGPLGDGQRKRTASISGEEGSVLSKRSKASGDPAQRTTPAVEKAEPGLEKARGWIRSQLKASMREFDQGLRHLSERIDRTQCLRKHEGIAIKIVKKISRLDRHINALIAFQRKEPSAKVKQPRTHAQCKMVNGATLPPNTNTASKLVPPTLTEILSPTAERSSGADGFPCVEAPKPSSGMLAAGAPAPPPKAATGYQGPPGDQTSESQDALVIDLTDEESKPDKGEKEQGAGIGHLGQPESLPQPSRESLDQVPPRVPRLPALPSVEPDPAPWKDLGDSPPPQKLELVVAQVNQPKGIALQWNIRCVDPRCAPIESFSLFICLEDVSSGTTSEWKRTSVIKALPLPMACSLSQFPRSVKCHFTMRAKDVHGRHGPFCEVQSISAL